MSLRSYLLAVIALAAGVQLMSQYWYNTAPPGDPALGVSFSCRQTADLGLPCAASFERLVRDVGVRAVRLSVYWDQTEPQPGRFDFSQTDRLIAIGARYGVHFTLVVGVKGLGYPELYAPSWLPAAVRHPPTMADYTADPRLRDALLRYVRATAQHYALNPWVEAWQVENEPYVVNVSEIHGWTVDPAAVDAEIALVRATDPLHRPVVVTHSAWTRMDVRWKTALAQADVLGEDVYLKKRILSNFLYLYPYELGPLTPNLPGQARLAAGEGKQFWITELQAEPSGWGDPLRRPGDRSRTISPSLLRQYLDVARRSGASRVYFWGAEWWLYQAEVQHDPSMLDAARQLFAAAPAPTPASKPSVAR